MQVSVSTIVAGCLALGMLLATSPAAAIVARDLQELRILSHHFTTTIATEERTLSTKDPAKGRYLVLKLSGTVPKDEAVVFAPDFVLVYSHRDGQEDRADCAAIGTAKTAAPGEFTHVAAGNVPRVTLRQGKAYFGLAFWIEPDVSSLTLYRIGAGPLPYRIGADRSYSVSIFTNSHARLLAEAKKVLQDGDYHVVQASESLAQDKTGATIHYAERAENPAREISQRLIRTLGVTPTLKKMALLSRVDIVVWLGK